MIIGGIFMDELFEKILNHAINYKTSDIHILMKQKCSVSFRQHGDLVLYDTFESHIGLKLFNYIRFKSNIDINYRLRPQTGHLNYIYQNQIYYLRISSLPGRELDSIVIRILNNHQQIALDKLTIFKETTVFLKHITTLEAGLFIVSGATGSGKSTTLYTLLDSINATQQRNIVTLEDPVEIKKEYCLQIQINEKLGITYNNSLKQILRHDPDVIMIGEIRDEQTARLAVTCALTGHLVLTTIHSSNCLTTIRRLLNLGLLKIDIEDVLNLCLIIHQTEKIKLIEQNLVAGKAFDEVIIEIDFDNTFIEYFKFFRFKNNISTAIEHSLKICRKKEQIFTQLKKELTYPVLLIIFLMFFSLFIVYGLLPSIMQLFVEFNISPSIITRIIFKLFEIIPIIVIFIILSFTVFFTISIYAIKRKYFKLIDLLIEKIVLIRRLIQKYYSLKFALYYNELLINGYDSTDIIVMLYEQIDDSDIKMIIYEIYRQVLEGEALEDIINDFEYFEPLFIAYFKLLIHDNQKDKSLDNYLRVSIDTLHMQVTRLIKLFVPIIYCFVAGFVILVYVAIVIPMMNVVSNL